MKKYPCMLILILMIAVLFPAVSGAIQTDAEVNALQVYVSGQVMTVFTDRGLSPDGLTCAVSNQLADITASGLLSDPDALVKTTVLVDVSTSMPVSVRDGVIATLKKLVERKSANEEYKLAVFGEALSTLHDFSPDRYDLATAIDKIRFESRQSKIYDAIYNTIPAIAPSDGIPAFCRTIVITDGADDAPSGITKEELFIRLQNERYPIDVVAVSGTETAENKELAAIVRMSGGRFYALTPNTDAEALAQKLGVSDYFYFEAAIPDVLLDGTTRQVDISDGVYGMSLDVKFPVFNIADTVSPAEPENLTSNAGSSGTSTTSGSTSPAPQPGGKPAAKSANALFGGYATVIFTGAGIALIIIIAVIIATSAVRKKKKTARPPEPAPFVGYSVDSPFEKTEFVSDYDFTGASYTVKLSSINDPAKSWTLPVDGDGEVGDLIIGRAEHCPVRLDDKSVSREHCKITAQGSGLVVVHLGSTNKTSLNGSNVTGSSPLQSGDTIKIGREALRIDYIQSLGSSPPNDPEPDSQRESHKGQTESIF